MLLGACSTSSTSTTSSTAASTTITTTSAPPTTTIAPAETTTTTEAVEILLPANDVDDPTEAIVAIFDYVSYIARAPEQARNLLGLVYAETCDCYERLLMDFDEYVANGWIQDDQGIRISDAAVAQRFDSGDVLLEVTYTYAPQYVLDRDGNQIRLEDDEWTDLISLIGLELGGDGRWRVGVIGLVGEEF